MSRWPLALFLTLLLASPLRAEDLATLNRATAQAMAAGDGTGAVTQGEAALSQPGPVTDRVQALSYLGYALFLQGQQPQRAEALVTQAMDAGRGGRPTRQLRLVWCAVDPHRPCAGPWR